MITTLANLKIKYAKAPKMIEAIDQAIKAHGEAAEAMVISGLPSTNSRSNLSHITRNAGWITYQYYLGARAGRQANDGYKMIVVRMV